MTVEAYSHKTYILITLFEKMKVQNSPNSAFVKKRKLCFHLHSIFLLHATIATKCEKNATLL